jgi:hypothetical protein
MPRLSQTADALEERGKALIARAKGKRREIASVARKKEVHKNILIGAFIQRHYGKDLSKLGPEVRAALDRETTRPWDRDALGLSALPVEPPTPCANA